MESRAGAVLASVGLGAVILIGCFAFGVNIRGDENGVPVTQPHVATSHLLRFLAVGDINLGRSAGQKILAGDTLFSFRAVQETFARYGLVFGNLESNLSDQQGETEDPENNMVFTAPPAAASALARAGVSMVSTANNHALDYGIGAVRETIGYLREAGVLFAGTDPDGEQARRPAIIERNGIRIALFACTDIMNIEDPSWHRSVADADTVSLFPLLRSARNSADFIILSVHGGDEYADRPTVRMRELARSAIDAGADLVLGHHPHIPYGIEYYKGRYIVHSLGNFVFYQPSRYWTMSSYAFEADIMKDSAGTRIETFRCLPVRCGLQPVFLPPGADAEKIQERVRELSSVDVAEGNVWHD